MRVTPDHAGGRFAGLSRISPSHFQPIIWLSSLEIDYGYPDAKPSATCDPEMNRQFTSPDEHSALPTDNGFLQLIPLAVPIASPDRGMVPSRILAPQATGI